MTVSSIHPEVILNVVGEGGGYTILGEQHQGSWRFWREPDSSDEFNFDDDDGEKSTRFSEEDRPAPSITYAYSLDEVLKEINSCWPRLHPIQVHPAFSQNIWNLVSSYDRHNRSPSEYDVLPRWRECCSERLPDSMDQLIATPWDLPTHWHDFASGLRLTLAQMKEDQFLILTCKGTNRFVQFSLQHRCMRIEAISNHFLPRRDALGPKDINTLHRLGWRSPTGSPEQATPERDPNGSCNFFKEVPIPHDYTDVVTLAIKTLSLVMGAPHDGYLVYQAFDSGGDDLSFAGLGIKRELQDPDLRMGELADRLLDVLKEITGCAKLAFDDDGDVAVEFDGQGCLVRLTGHPPMVKFYLPLRSCAKPSKELWESLNQLNAYGGPVRHFWTNNCAYAMLDIPAWPLQAQHVETSLALFTSVASKSALWLHAEFGISAMPKSPKHAPH